MSTRIKFHRENSQTMTKKNVLVIVTAVILVIIALVTHSVIQNTNSKTNTPTSQTQSPNQKDTPKLELAKMTESDIKPSKDKVNAYIFWGDGCPHCKHLVEFLDEKKSEIGDKINLYSFEVWYNSTNRTFMKNFGKFLGENPKGVPYFIIGDKTFSGFGESDQATKDQIISLINSEYQKTPKTDKYQEYKTQKQ